MISEEKIAEARRAVRRGEPDGEIREQLKNEGYSEEDIRLVFAPHKYDMRSWYIFFAFLVTAVGLVLLFQSGNLLILILGILLFYAYYLETQRLKRQG